MDIAKAAIEKPVNTWLIILACLIGGVVGLLTIGRLEDPAFTIKEAVVQTAYPGASAIEVEEEVTERLESAIQQMPQLKRVRSTSMPGMSQINVEIRDEFTGPELPQIWDELRRRVDDTQRQLPPGAEPSWINDDFGDVFGMFYAVTAPGYHDREVTEIVKMLRRELLTVPGVAKIVTAGERQERIHVDIRQDRLANLGIPIDSVLNVLDVENTVQPVGSVRSGDRNVRVVASDGFDSLATVENLLIGQPGSTDMIRLGDIATITREPVERPDHLIRHNGQPAATIGISGVADANIVEIGQRVERHLAALADRLPIGVELHPIYEQPRVVDAAINGFLFNLLASVSIVAGVLCLFMGWRAGAVVGTVLFLTVLGTVFLMRVAGIEMERISLGALIIAMGMLVDNAIVVAEGMLIGMQRGRSAFQAASDAVRQTKWPLLGATIIGIMAFSGIGLSQDTTGEFLFSLFAVIGISLLLSWVLAITVTPLFGKYLFRIKPGTEGDDPYRGGFYTTYRGVLVRALRARWLTVGLLVATTAACFYGFGFLKSGFFPNSNTPLFYVNYWLPQGTDIRAVSRDMDEIEAFILDQPGVEGVSAFIGRGASRFMLTYAPEPANPSYGQFIVRVGDLDVIDGLGQRILEHTAARYPDAETTVDRLVFGPGSGAKIEARFAGPDIAVLRALSDQAEAILREDGRVINIRNDWRQRELILTPVFSEELARVAGIDRRDLAQALRFATDGVQAGSYREGDELIPIFVRPPADERLDVEGLRDRLVWSAAQQAYIPVAQVTAGLETVAEDTLIYRRDRVRTMTVEADPHPNETADEAFARVRPRIEALVLPAGYALEWGGEYEATQEAQGALMAQVPLGFLIMVVITVLLFGRVRQPLIIWLTVPMAVCGVTIGLLVTGLPFGFMSLLGFLSLSGMLIKNAIVLVDEIDSQIGGGKDRYDAVVDASVSRLRPVMLAAGTTILGMAPLLADAFFADMAVTIMGGLAFASVLTLVAVPVFYVLFFRIRGPEQEAVDEVADGREIVRGDERPLAAQ